MTGERLRFSDEAKRSLHDAERKIHDVLPDLEAAEECGVDCQYWRNMTTELQRRIRLIRERFPQVNEPLDAE